ncbi:inositol monophosphatase family protein [Streptomyces sp. NPDC101166]|uniref:inositol monophosphatase family protein n=1 Tax=Streptomyces sp. NPDC101166 TaxID=3366120 RepID=UPI00382CEA7C
MSSDTTRKLVETLIEAADAALDVIRSPAVHGPRDDVLADEGIDAAVVPLLAGRGMVVHSEESGSTVPPGAGRHAVIVDPLDGSRNFRLGVPWYAFSACLITDGRPAIGLVRNLATGESVLGIRDGGAWALDAGGRRRLTVAPVESLAAARVLYSGYPARPVPCATVRNLGSSALDLCAVASGDFHVSMDLSRSGTESWDHSAGLLIAGAAGAAVATLHRAPGRFGDGVFQRRHLVAAATPGLLHEATAWARREGPAPRR